MKSIRMIIFVLLLFLTACTPSVSTDTPGESAAGSPSPSPNLTTSVPTPTPAPSVDQATPPQGLAHPVPYISEIRLYHEIDVFTREDLALGPIAITSTQEDVLQALGEPENVTNNPFHSLGVVQTYYYQDCKIDFLLIENTYVIQNCTITVGDKQTPRGIGIGTTVRDTLLAYVDRIELAMDNRAIFYRSNAGSHSPEAVPPSGTIFPGETNAEWVFQFAIPVELNPYAGYTQEQIEERYKAMWYYMLRFTTEYGKVTRIDMSLGHYTE